MKKLYLLISLWLSIAPLIAQVTKTVISTAGNLKTEFTATEITTVTNLTITGSLDARDFNFIRTLSVLSVLDISAVTIQEYIGYEGYQESTLINPANEIPNSAFSSCRNCKSLPIKTITLPTSLTSIGDLAFYNCSNLTSITIPNSVTSIGEAVFQECPNLASITIPNSVTSINGNAFSETAWYTNWLNNQPDGVVYIGKVAYSYKGIMPANTSITLNVGTTEIADWAFNNCSNLTSITIPTSVISIGSFAFRGCIGLTSINIPSSVTSIGDAAFARCDNLTTITIPSSVTSIGDAVFDVTPWYINQPDGLIYAGKVAYKYKGSMPANTSIVLNDGTVGIAENAFAQCNNLSSITIPNSVAFVENYAFYDCSNLSSITIPGSIPSIGEGVFNGCTGLSSITIPNSVASIGYYAFAGCTSLISINIPISVIAIYGNAFAACSNLTSVTIPNSVIAIGSNAFLNCTSLTSVTIPNSVTSIGYWSFDNCTGLTSINIPNSIISIGAGAFNNCTGLSSIFANATTPVNLDPSLNTYYDVFYGVDKSSCTLYVPSGSKSVYQVSNQWKDFTNITETVTLSSISVNTDAMTSNAAVNIVFDNPWTATSNQTWCTISLSSESDNSMLSTTVSSPSTKSNSSTLYITVSENPSSSIRCAIITIVSADITQTITVTQAAAEVISSSEVIKAKKLKVYPCPSNGNITIDFGQTFDNYGSLTIKNMNGEQVFKQTINNIGIDNLINLSLNLPSDMYFIEVNDNKLTLSERIQIVK